MRGKRVRVGSGWGTLYTTSEGFLRDLPHGLQVYYSLNRFQRCSRMPKCRGAKNKENSNSIKPWEKLRGS